jgi:hypothetical protein
MKKTSGRKSCDRCHPVLSSGFVIRVVIWFVIWIVIWVAICVVIRGCHLGLSTRDVVRGSHLGCHPGSSSGLPSADVICGLSSGVVIWVVIFRVLHCIVRTVTGILVDLGHPQSRSSKSTLNWGTMSVPTFQTFFGTEMIFLVQSEN